MGRRCGRWEKQVSKLSTFCGWLSEGEMVKDLGGNECGAEHPLLDGEKGEVMAVVERLLGC